MSKVIFGDCETVHISPGPATIWELALIIRDGDGPDQELVWHIRPDASRADAGSARFSRYYARCQAQALDTGDGKIVHDSEEAPEKIVLPGTTIARHVAQLCADAVLVGANFGSFDVPHLDTYLRAQGECLAADYHYQDIGSMVAGWRAGKDHGYNEMADLMAGIHKDCEWTRPERHGVRPFWGPLKLSDAASIAGLDADAYTAHEALDDARVVRDIWDVIWGGAEPC